MSAGLAPSLRDDGSSPIFGRAHELARLHEMVDDLADRGRALLVTGEPGIGKSALISAAGRRAQRAGARVLRTTGVQLEAELPFAGLHQLLLPLLDEIDRLPAPQRSALSSAFGMSEAADAPDRFLIGLAVLELLSDAADRTLVVADDAQWLDASSIGILAFVARRLEHEPVGLLLAVRPGDADPFVGTGLEEIVLGGLDAASAEAMLVAQGRELAADVRGSLLEQAQGNPLALIELPVPLSSDELTGGTPLPAPLPLTARQLEQAFATQATALPPPTCALMLLAASDEAASVSEILEAASREGGEGASADDLVPAVSAGLMAVEAERVTFRHPLVRSAIQQMASPAEGRAAHAALADVLQDQPDRRICHQAAAIDGSDEHVAAALEETAERAARRGAIGSAISSLERSSGLSDDGARAGRRLLRAAELAFDNGHRTQARRLLSEAQRLDLTPGARQGVSFMRMWFSDEGLSGGTDLGAVVDVAENIGRSGDPRTAASLLVFAASLGYSSSAGADLGERIIRVGAGLDVGRDDPTLVVARAVAATLHPGADAIGPLREMRRRGEEDPEAAVLLGFAANALGDFDLATSFLGPAVDELRAQGRVAVLAMALLCRASAHRGSDRFDLAASDADEARRLSEESGLPVWATAGAASAALVATTTVAAVRGEVERAEELAVELERVSLPLGSRTNLAHGQWARGLAALGAGRHEEAYEQLGRVVRRDDPAWHHTIRHLMIGDLAEAARNTGRLDEGRGHLTETEAANVDLAFPATRVAIEYARAMLAEDDEVEAQIERALGGGPAGRPFLRARLQLALGAHLRRQRRVVESRAPLRAARAGFDALGARGWAERARQELRAAGVESRPRPVNASDDLTPQELQIVRMAATGLTNRDIGQRLFLSHRTVGAHLYRAFPKLGVTARAQLREVVEPATA